MSYDQNVKRKSKRERTKFEFYPTELPLARAQLRLLPLDEIPARPRILDLGAGEGVYGQAARELWSDAYIVGVEVRDLPKPPYYDEWHIASAASWTPPDGELFDIVIGNPPYGDPEDQQNRRDKAAALAEGREWVKPPRKTEFCDAEVCVRRAMELLKPGGYCCYLLRSAFSSGYRDGLYDVYPLWDLVPLMERPSFTGDRKTDATDYSIFFWRKGGPGRIRRLVWLKDPNIGTQLPLI